MILSNVKNHLKLSACICNRTNTVLEQRKISQCLLRRVMHSNAQQFNPKKVV